MIALPAFGRALARQQSAVDLAGLEQRDQERTDEAPVLHAVWEILARERPGRLKPLGSIPRDGFETAMVVRTSDPHVAVRANDCLGRTLGTSAPVKLSMDEQTPLVAG